MFKDILLMDNTSFKDVFRKIIIMESFLYLGHNTVEKKIIEPNLELQCSQRSFLRAIPTLAVSNFIN